MVSTGHAKLLSEICDFLRKNGIWYVRTNSHGYGRKGIPDILACYRGAFVGIEAKIAPDTPKPWQLKELGAIREAGGKALVVYNIGELGHVFP